MTFYELSNSSSQIGSFGTTYNILGTISSIKESQELIISTIVNDYDKSPFIGYILLAKNNSSSNLPELPNPFVDKSTINERITNEIHTSIDSIKKLESQNIILECDFGMEITKWNCNVNDLLNK